MQWCAMSHNVANYCTAMQCCTNAHPVIKCTNEPNVTPKLQSSKKKLIQFIKAFEDSQQPSNPATRTNMSYSTPKTKTTYRASSHPKWQRANPNSRPAALDIPISIIVQPALTFHALCELRDQITNQVYNQGQTQDQGQERQEQEYKDQLLFREALNREVIRCTPKWMRRANQPVEQVLPTQHACIDPTQVTQLEGILSPETLRRTFISIPALMTQIQDDITTRITEGKT